MSVLICCKICLVVLPALFATLFRDSPKKMLSAFTFSSKYLQMSEKICNFAAEMQKYCA